MHATKDEPTTAIPATDRDGQLLDLGAITPELTEWDQRAYRRITSTQLSPEQTGRIVTPNQTYPRQTAVLAIHWHPEWIPIELTMARVDAMFPNTSDRLIIPLSTISS